MLRHLYTPFLYAISPLIILRLVIRGFKNRAYWRRWGERFGFSEVSPGGIWIHAVSVGEVQAAAPLIDALLPSNQVLVTTMTPTGSAQLMRLFPTGVKHCYAPYDFPSAVKRFLNRTRPQALVVLETEIWPNIIACCRGRDIGIAFVNLRLSQRSFDRYCRIKGVMGRVLAQVDCFAVQSKPDAQRLVELGADPAAVHVTGSVKFEVDLPPSLSEVAQVLRREWGQERTVLIGGSTHEGEEEFLLDAYQRLKNDHPKLLLVLVPRHPERFNIVTRICKRKRLNTVVRSEDGSMSENVDVYVGDTMGELSLMYAASDIAFVGGSLMGKGGHNILEPCALGLPVMFGPHMFNFLQISELAIERGAAVRVDGIDDFVKVVEGFISDANLRFKFGEAGRELIRQNRGALERTMAVLEQKAITAG